MHWKIVIWLPERYPTHCRGGSQPPARYNLTITNQVGRIRTVSDVVSFNRTRSFIAWREAKSLPYNGYGLHAIQPSARFRYVAGGW